MLKLTCKKTMPVQKKSIVEMGLKGLQAVDAVMRGLHRLDSKKDSGKQAC